MNLYVGNLSLDVVTSDLEELFGELGAVKSAVVIRDKFSGESRGFGFVEMGSQEEGKNAIDKLDGQELKGKKIVVNQAKPRQERRDRRGPHRGGGGGGGGYRRF
jgi:cold-inducible RNA-binding protein